MQAQILLTLSAGSLKSLVDSGEVALEEIPSFAMKEFDLRGLNVPASMFAGCSIEKFDQLRDNADKAGCPVLILVEEQPLIFAYETDEQRDSTLERIGRLAVAANRLGCNSLAVRCHAPQDDEDTFDLTVEGIKEAINKVEQLDLNLLIAPTDGLTNDPDRLTDLIKRVGGFRIGSFPNFGHAEGTGEPTEALRKLAPYAGGIEATVSKGKSSLEVGAAIDSILSVGYLNTLAINFEGSGDPVKAVRAARKALADALGQLDEDELEELLEMELPVGATEGDSEGDSEEGGEDSESDSDDESAEGEEYDEPEADQEGGEGSSDETRDV